jgi:hypothetical protein
MSALFLAFVCILSVAFADHPNFVPYGAAQGDTLGSACDDCYYGPINFDFIFYGQERTSLFVDNNGLISFDSGISQYTPVGMSAASFPAIAPYWADVDTRGTGQVWYGTRSDPTLLASLSSRISSTFHGNRAFVATWDRVGYYGAHTDKVNSFQAVLIADAIGNSWVFFNYDGLQWTTGDASGGSGGLGGTPGSVGFSNGAGTYVQTAESLTSAVLNTHDSLTQVNGVVIVLPPPAPTQTCGNGIVEGTEDCDGGNCCNADCTFAMDAPCYCSRQTWNANEVFGQNYFCVPGNVNQFYQCLQGPWASQSALMNCAAGTTCGCAIGTECSCDGYQAPCVTAGTQQVC